MDFPNRSCKTSFDSMISKDFLCFPRISLFSAYRFAHRPLPISYMMFAQEIVIGPARLKTVKADDDQMVDTEASRKDSRGSIPDKGQASGSSKPMETDDEDNDDERNADFNRAKVLVYLFARTWHSHFSILSPPRIRLVLSSRLHNISLKSRKTLCHRSLPTLLAQRLHL